MEARRSKDLTSHDADIHTEVHTLLHWNISPSSNSRVRIPTGSSWIDRPQNFVRRLLSPQNFHPLPSQWQAMRVGWWLTCFNSKYRWNVLCLKRKEFMTRQVLYLPQGHFVWLVSLSEELKARFNFVWIILNRNLLPNPA